MRKILKPFHPFKDAAASRITEQLMRFALKRWIH